MVALRLFGALATVFACAAAANAASQQPKHPPQPTVQSRRPNKKPCYQHYRPAHVERSVPPITPQIAITDGVTGTVEVIVNVRANGDVIGAQAVSGPALLRQAAVDAALATKFRPEIHDCRAMPGEYSYFVDFKGA